MGIGISSSSATSGFCAAFSLNSHAVAIFVAVRQTLELTSGVGMCSRTAGSRVTVTRVALGQVFLTPYAPEAAVELGLWQPPIATYPMMC